MNWRLDETTDADGSPSCLVFAEVEPGISEVVVKASKRFPDYRDHARLIAAAPDLLEALRAIHEWQAGSEVLPVDIWQQMRAAIAKAEGRS